MRSLAIALLLVLVLVLGPCSNMLWELEHCCMNFVLAKTAIGTVAVRKCCRIFVLAKTISSAETAIGILEFSSSQKMQ